MIKKIINNISIYTCWLKSRGHQTGKRLSKSRGFSLVELMVSCSILVILISSIFGALTSGRRLWTVSVTQMDLSASGRNAMSRMFEELSQAGQSTISVGTGLNTVTFQTPDSYAGGITVWSNQIRYSLGGLNGQQILRTDLVSGDVETWGNNITLLRFNQTKDDTIDIRISLSKQSIKGDIITLQLGSQVKLRNE